MDPLNSASSAPLTAAQQAALKKLDAAATQLEGVFLGMLFKAMRKTVDQGPGLFGPTSNAEKTWTEMLDEQRADQMAKSGSLGIAKMIEGQLRASVLGSSATASAAENAAANAAATAAAGAAASMSANAGSNPLMNDTAGPLEGQP